LRYDKDSIEENSYERDIKEIQEMKEHYENLKSQISKDKALTEKDDDLASIKKYLETETKRSNEKHK
jgi:hypothetical protein